MTEIPGSGHAPRVLVVDDEASVVRPLLRGLTAAGFVAAYAPDGIAALAALSEAGAGGRRFDALLTDIQMPRLKGDALQRRARADDPDLAVMLITAQEDTSLAVACMREGVADYVTKPFSIDDIVVRLQAALEKRGNVIRLRDYQENLEARLAERTAQVQSQFLQALDSLNCALEAKDAYTCDHSARVRTLAVALVDRLFPDDPTLRERVDTAARLHDIGKIGVPEAIINKPGRLDSEEFGLIQKHPAAGSDILLPLIHDPGVLEIVLHHHECWNGTGYPHGLIGEAIPLGARILAVVDSFDAMTSTRSYRKALPVPRALEILRDGAGKQWDPQAVSSFVGLVTE